MSKISSADVLKLASLARLSLSEEEVEKLQKELSEILTYIEQLQDIDTVDIAPTYQVTGLSNSYRQDIEQSYSVSGKQLLENAPAQEDGLLKVKRMIR